MTKKLLFLLLLALTAGTAFSQTTNTWSSNATSTDWNTATNWSQGRVPLATDNVVIGTATNQPVLSSAASANSVEVQSGASLSITSAGSLTINGSKNVGGGGTTAFINRGTVTNEGQLVIGNTASVGTFGLLNVATFSNQTGGRIQIDRSGDYGLYNASGSFTNSATITIGANAAVGNTGLYNQAPFSNQPGGRIQIDNSTTYGLNNDRNSSFTNSATITIGANAAVGLCGLYNFSFATFSNQPGGRIQIDNSTIYGLYNGSGIFTNSATITIGARTSVGQYGLLNNATFSNEGCGALLNIVADAVIDNFTSFSNTGTIIENATGTSNITYNGGLVQNRNGGTFNIDINAGILVEPITGCTTIGISPALQIGASNTLSVGTTWYADAALTTAVGTYSPNSLTLTGGNTGRNTVYFAVTDAASSCTTIASVDVSLSLAVGITAQPAAGSAVCVGGTVTASVSATGTAGTPGGPLTYQWYKDGNPVNSQTAATLMLSNVQTTDAGSYSVVVTGACNSLTSNAFSLTVNTPPSVSNPATTTATAGSAFSQPFTASGGSGSYSFSLASGTLPTGLSLAPTGVLSGTPTRSGSFSITVRATDANGCSGVGATYALVVNQGQPIRYVRQGGSGAGDGTSWANASANLQSQINAPDVQQVWVAAGIYKPTTGADRTISFSMKNGVAIYGGFAGGETALSQRPAVNPITGQPSSTTLSGDIGTVGDNSDNSYHVISNGNLDNTAVLDGFVLTGGNANGNSPNDQQGGAMYNYGDNSSPTLTNCAFLNNSATFGGAMYNRSGFRGNSSPTLTNCAFQNNSATDSGGAMFNVSVYGTISPTLTNCSFQANSATNKGGAMFNYNSLSTNSPTLTNCAFQSNSANSGGAMYNNGHNGNSSPTLTNCAFQANSATDSGGAMYNNGEDFGNSSPTLTNCAFLNNSATSGGAMFNNGQDGTISPTLTNCSFLNNSATTGNGGAISNESGSPLLVNSVFQNNQAFSNGGAVYSHGNGPSLTNCSLQANTAGSGGALHTFNCVATLTNSVIFGNGGANSFVNNVTNGVDSGQQLTYCLVEASASTALGLDLTGPGNLTTITSPFASTATTELSACSPAINAGNPATTSATVGTTDLAGNPRIVDGRVDMGAVEFQSLISFGITSQPAAGSAVCAGGSVSASVSVTGTVSGYQWYNANGAVTGQNSATLSLPNAQPGNAGRYSVVVTGACNSVTSTVFSLTVNDLPVSSLVSSGTLTCAQTSITLTASGGVSQPGTAYAFSTGATQIGSSNQATVTTAGVYSVTVANASGCISTASTTISEDKTPPSLSLTASRTVLTCANPTALLTASGTGTFQWSDNSTNQTLTVGTAGVYSVTLTGANGCISTVSTTISEDKTPPVLNLTASRTTLTCANPTATLTASGMGTVRWSDNSTNSTLTVGTAGVYSVTLTGANGCISTTSISVSEDKTPPVLNLTASRTTLTCANPTALLTALGTGAVQWSDNSTNSTLTVSAAGVYSGTLTGANGCISTTSTTVTGNTTPPTQPTLLVEGTTTNQLTRSQNTGSVNLVASGCNGSLSWTGSDGSSGTGNLITVSLANVGTFVYQATCSFNGCTSPPASATVTVTSPNLTVLYRNEDDKTSNDKIKPFFALSNGGSEALPLSQITVRYWLTVEDYNALDLKINNAKLFGSGDAKDQVSLRYVGLGNAPRQGAYGYLEYSFMAGAGTLGAGVTTGTVESEIKKQGGGLPNTNNFDESDDYSYMPNSKAKTLVANSMMTAYRNGVLIWGTEPTAITPTTAFKVNYEDESGDKPATAKPLKMALEVRNVGNLPVDYSRLTVRYWLTVDDATPITTSIDKADLGKNVVSARLVKLTNPVGGADSYVELSFAGSLGQLYPLSGTGDVEPKLEKDKDGRFNLLNDYSYLAGKDPQENTRITVYVDGALVYGTEPSGSPRLGVETTEPTLSVRVLGNPVGETLTVEVTGAQGQPLTLTLSDLTGRVVNRHDVEQAGAVETVRLSVGSQSAGLLLLQVSSPTQLQTVKVIKP